MIELLELRDFVAKTLEDIVDGVEQANKKKNRFHLSGGYHKGEQISGEIVEFEVSVATNNKTVIDGKGKIGIFVVGAQLGGSKEHNLESVGTIKFHVFITEK
jgi:hypothetical protein